MAEEKVKAYLEETKEKFKADVKEAKKIKKHDYSGALAGKVKKEK